MSSVTHEPGSITGQASLSFTGKAQVPKRLRLISLGVAACRTQVMGVERPRRVEVRLSPGSVSFRCAFHHLALRHPRPQAAPPCPAIVENRGG